jgi:hypothetical protein
MPHLHRMFNPFISITSIKPPYVIKVLVDPAFFLYQLFISI